MYEQAIALAPDYFEAHYNRANVLHDAARFDQAAESYDAALALDPDHADAHFYLAVTLEKLEQLSRGAAALGGVSAPGAGRRVGGTGEGSLPRISDELLCVVLRAECGAECRVLGSSCGAG